MQFARHRTLREEWRGGSARPAWMVCSLRTTCQWILRGTTSGRRALGVGRRASSVDVLMRDVSGAGGRQAVGASAVVVLPPDDVTAGGGNRRF